MKDGIAARTAVAPVEVERLVSTQTDLPVICSFFYFCCRDIKKAEQMTIEWADKNGFPVPENIRCAVA